jgi:hypothetical protein
MLSLILLYSGHSKDRTYHGDLRRKIRLIEIIEVHAKCRPLRNDM